jgi:hypothetical protein
LKSPMSCNSGSRVSTQIGVKEVRKLKDRNSCGGKVIPLVLRFRGSNHIDIINQPRPEERALLRASRRTATGDMVPAAILRDAVLRTAPQDEVRGLKFQMVRSDRFHGIDPLVEIKGLLTPYTRGGSGVAWFCD